MNVHKLLVVCMLPWLVGCATRSPSPVTRADIRAEARFSSELASAVADKDRDTALKLAHAVLIDARDLTYQHGFDARKFAADAVQSLNLSELAPLVREVAALPFHHREEKSREANYRDFLDITAISDALTSLVVLEDPEAVTLNRGHVRTPVVGSGAIGNLRVLRDWEMTATIRRLAWELQPKPEELMEFLASVRFLRDSPKRSAEDCVLVRHIRDTYAPCFQAGQLAPKVAGCNFLAEDLKVLEDRLECDGNRP